MGDSPAAAGVGSQHKPLLSCGCGSVSCPFVTLKVALNGCTWQTSDTFSSWVSQHMTCTWCDGDGSCVEVATSAPSGRGAQVTGCTVFDTSVFHHARVHMALVMAEHDVSMSSSSSSSLSGTSRPAGHSLSLPGTSTSGRSGSDVDVMLSVYSEDSPSSFESSWISAMPSGSSFSCHSCHDFRVKFVP